MKVLEFTVRFSVGTEKEQSEIMALLGVKGCDTNPSTDGGVKSKESVAYTPASDRTKAAAEALSKCKRVGVLRLEVLETWANAFPHVDLASEIMKCEAWAESKGVTRTPRGWQKALNSWLSKAQDSTKGSVNLGPARLVGGALTVKPVEIEAETEAWLKAAA